MKYQAELLQKWRPLAGAGLGMAAGYNITLYITNIFTPYLLQAFGWSKAQLSLVGAVSLCTVICGPIAGRLVDRFGAHAIATLGVVCAPFVFFAYSFMQGDFRVFVVINIAQVVLLGMFTTSVVYQKVIAEQFTLTRGIALAIVVSTPALLGAALTPPLSRYIDAYGWRAGYCMLGLCSAIGGIAALLLLPRHVQRASAQPSRRSVRHDYRVIFRTPAFRIIFVGMFLCNLPLMTHATQLKVILLDRALSSDAASWMISLYDFTVVIGRLGCGIALDRLPTHRVVAAALALPAVGLFILASGAQTPALLAFSIALLGISMGADGDIMAYVVMRFFPYEVFSSVLGLVGSAVAAAGAVGAILLSWTLNLTSGFSTFLFIAGIAAVISGAMFLRLGADPHVTRATVAAAIGS